MLETTARHTIHSRTEHPLTKATSTERAAKGAQYWQLEVHPVPIKRTGESDPLHNDIELIQV